ncbi:MAG: hypothetical protein PSX71_04335 [bacterium]|nr:hypothetical protein [bacterium]
MRRLKTGLIEALLACSLLTGCGGGSSAGTTTGSGSPPVIPSGSDPLSIPAYPASVASLENSSWESCVYEAGSGKYLRQLWSFGTTTLDIGQYRHDAIDTACTGASTRDWYYTYDSISDGGSTAALGWVDQAGTQTLDGAAPLAQDALSSLPGQPSVRRTSFGFKFIYFGGATPPFSTFSSLKMIFFVDASASPHRLFIGGVTTLNADGYPSYLMSYRGFTRI